MSRMTKLARSSVTRETPATVFDQGRRLPVVCTMSTDGLHLRQKGRRTCYVLPYAAAYNWAIHLEVERQRREKREVRRAKLEVRRG